MTVVGGTAARALPLVRMLDAMAAVLDVEPSTLTDEASPETIPSWDSLNHLNVAMAVESEFGITFTADEVMTIGSVAAIRAALRGHGVDL